MREENDEQYDRPAKVPQGCICGDMPGRCPGRDVCELCKPEVKTCPKCHSGDYNAVNHPAGFGAPEAYTWQCADCDHESEPE